jgi:sugar phosphate isomerase/epimerase
MKLAFSTLGCPHWELERIAQAARDYGYTAIELRAVAGDLDLLKRPELQPGTIEKTRRWLADQDVSVCCVDSSCTFDSRDADERRQQVEIAIHHCEIAAGVGAPLIRIFPDKVQDGATREETRDNIAACLHEVAQRGPGGVRVGMETHGDFARADASAEIMRLADHPGVTLIWDIANSVAAGDSIEEAANAVAPYLAHVHLRDARAIEGQEHWLPVLAGRGDVDFSKALAALNRLDYRGYISFEWEKYWRPEIEDPEIAFPDFIRAMNQLSQSNVVERSIETCVRD